MTTTTEQTFVSIENKFSFADRTQCMAVTFKDMISDHPAAKLLKGVDSNIMFLLGGLTASAREVHYKALCDAPGNPPGFVPPRPHYLKWLPADDDTETRDQEIDINIGLKHELMDRASNVRSIFEKLIAKHPAAVMFKDDIDKIGNEMDEMYQEASALYLE